jgi:hypothetical protein
MPETPGRSPIGHAARPASASQSIIYYRDATLQSFKLPAAAFVILWTLLALLPLLALAPALIPLKDLLLKLARALV